MADIKLIKELLLKNPTLNNVQISKLYAEHMGIEAEVLNFESFRKKVKKVRDGMKMGNSASKHTSKKFYNTGYEKVRNEHDDIKDQFRYTKIDNDKGTLLSEIVVSFEPRDEEEWAKLHKVNLDKYKISNYWSKLQPDGKFTCSLLCSLRKVGDSIDLDEAKKILIEAVKEGDYKVEKKDIKLSKANDKALIFWISDEHVGASVSGSIYKNDYNSNIYFTRKSKVLGIAYEQFKLHGRFDKIIFCSLGDNLDGFNGKTTRSLLSAPTHGLEQNMTNYEAVKTYVDVNKAIFDSLIDYDITNSIELYNVNNSNHGGLGFDNMGAFALRQYLETKYGDFVKITDMSKIIEKFQYGKMNFYLTHGKDEHHMKKNMPIMLNHGVENYFKEFIDDNGSSLRPNHNIVVKGDLHQFATQQGRWFTYQNCPSLFGSSAWVHANIGKGQSGFCYSVLGSEDESISFKPFWTT